MIDLSARAHRGIVRIPLLPFMTAFLAGRLLAAPCPPDIWPWGGLGLLFALLVASLVLRLQVVSLLVLLSLFGVLGYVAAPPLPVVDSVRYVLLDKDAPGVFEGRVVRVQPRPGGRARCTVHLFRVCSRDGCLPVSARVLLTFERPAPVSGRQIRFRTRLSRFEPDRNPGVSSAASAWLRQGLVRKGFVASGRWAYVVRDASKPDGLPGARLWDGPSRFREQVRDRIDAGFRERFSRETLGLALGLSLGDRSEIDGSVRTFFANAGLAHLLAISGTHMALMALGLEVIARHLLLLFSVARRRGLVAALSPALASVGVAAYAWVVGLTPAMGRALLMAVAALLLRSISRRVDSTAVLVLAAFVVGVVEPYAIWDVGCQLSFASVLFLIRLVGPVSLAVKNRLARFPEGWIKAAVIRLLQLVAVSAVATVGTAALCAYHFGTIAWAGVFANVVAVPLVAGLGLPLVVLAGLGSLCGLPGVGVLFSMAGVVLRASIAVAAYFGGRAVFSPWRVALSPGSAVLLMAFTAVFLVEGRGRRWWGVGASLAIAGLLWWQSRPPAASGRFEVTQLDVGQGDCFVLAFPDGQVAVLDAGGAPNPSVYLAPADGRGVAAKPGVVFDPGTRIVEPYLRHLGYRRIDYLILSHPHPDHLGGLLSLVETMPVGQAWIAEIPDRRGLLARYVDRLIDRGVPVTVVDAGASVGPIGGVSLRVLHPYRGWRRRMRTKRGRSTNNASMVLLATYGRVDLLFTGDMEKEVETRLVASGSVPRVEWVKVPHHGSDTSSTEPLVSAARPEVAAISVGKGNRYGFPRRSVVRRWALAGAKVFRTDRQGAVAYSTDGVRLVVRPFLGVPRSPHVFEALADMPSSAGAGPSS